MNRAIAKSWWKTSGMWSSLWRDSNGLKYWSQEKRKYSRMLIEGGSKKLRKHKKEYHSYWFSVYTGTVVLVLYMTRSYLVCMSSNSQTVNPVQDLLDRITELQRRLEDLEPNIRNNRVRTQYENVRTKLADAKSSIWALGTVIDRYSA